MSRVVGSERFDVVDRGQRTAERVVFDEACCDEIVRGAKNRGRFLAHLARVGADASPSGTSSLRLNSNERARAPSVKRNVAVILRPWA